VAIRVGSRGQIAEDTSLNTAMFISVILCNALRNGTGIESRRGKTAGMMVIGSQQKYCAWN
jgi:hypothetical protein